jgi:hypothetical protein
VNKPTWGVVATVNEPPALLAAFAAHYVSAGASQIHLFFDQPNPEAAALLARFPQVRITLCGTSHYRARWKCRRPVSHRRRQRLNATDAYGSAEADWLLHVDADELIETDHLADELAGLPQELDYLKLANTERVHLSADTPLTIFDGAARRTMDIRQSQIAELLGVESYEYTKDGMSGHTMGKSMTRTGRKRRIGIHHPIGKLELNGQDAVATICHFDGLTPFHFALKLMRYAKGNFYDSENPIGEGRQMQIYHARETGFALDRLKDLHRLVATVAAERVAPLRQGGWIREIGKSPLAAARQFFTEAELDLSVAAFDRALAKRSKEATQLYARWVELGLDG